MNIFVRVFNDKNKNGIFDVNADSIISNIYITLRTPSGNCISQQTDNYGTTFSNLTTTGDYMIYETLQSISGYYPISSFDTLVAPLPYANYLPTTNRKAKVSITSFNSYTDTVVNFGHSLYSNIACSNKGYLTAIPNGVTTTTALFEFGIASGKSTYLNTYNIGYLNALTYNEAEGLLYGMVGTGSNTSQMGYLYRIEGPPSYTLTALGIPKNKDNNNNFGSINISSATCDNKGNLFCCYLPGNFSGSRYSIKIDLNPTSLNYLYYTSLSCDFNTYGMADWAISNTTNKIYGFYDYKYTDYLYYQKVECCSIVEFTINQNNLIPSTFITDWSAITDFTSSTPRAIVMVGVFGFNDNYMYLLSGTGKIYRVNMNSPGKKTLELYSNLPANANNGDGANCTDGFILTDFGNAPESTALLNTAAYKTTLKSRGPRHVIYDNIHLGDVVYHEYDATIGPSAIDNDSAFYPLPTMYTYASKYLLPINCYNNTGTIAYLYGWLDFNTDGIFDKNECVTYKIPSSSKNQLIRVEFNRPTNYNSSLPNTFIRLRLTTDSLDPTPIDGLANHDPRSISYYTAASDGEVEDYLLSINNVSDIRCYKTANKSIVEVGDTLVYTITITNYGSIANNVIVKDDFTLLSNQLNYISGQYVYNSTVYPVTIGQFKNGVVIPNLNTNQIAVFTIITSVK